MFRHLVSSVALTCTALVGSLLAAAPAAQATPEWEYEQFEQTYWFGKVKLEWTTLGGVSEYTSLKVVHPTQDHPLPFHSYLKADLYDCSGQRVSTRWGEHRSVKRKGKPWRTTAEVNLNLPRKGTYATWVVSLVSKGRPTTRVTVTDGGPFFQLGCDGSYRRSKNSFYSSSGHALKRPINADFSRPADKVVAQHVSSFGTPKGVVRPGRTVSMRGMRMNKRGKATGCSVFTELRWDARPDLIGSYSGTGCDSPSLEVPRTAEFRKPYGRWVTRSPRGKRLIMGSLFMVNGHPYVKEFDRGILR